MIGDRQMIIVIITFRKSNENSQVHRAGAYWSNGKKKTPYMRQLSFIFFVSQENSYMEHV